MREHWLGSDEVFLALVRGMWACGSSRLELTPDEAVGEASQVIHGLEVSEADRAMLLYVVALTVNPASMRSSHVEALRHSGHSEREIHDIVMVISCFSFMNRLADGTGVTVKAGRHELAIALLGEEALNEHLEWSGL